MASEVNRTVAFNSEIAILNYRAMEVWRELLANGWTAQEARDLNWMLDRLAQLRLQREYPPYEGPPS